MRNELDSSLGELVAAVVAMGERTDQMLEVALQVLQHGHLGAVEQIRAADSEVDRAYERLQHGVVAAIARHSPVGTDLRLLTGLLHVSLHVERMGDYAVNVGQTAQRAADLPDDQELIDQLLEMGARAREVGALGLRSFVQRDLHAAQATARIDDDVDRLDLGTFHRLIRLAAADEHRLEWATRMLHLPRALERYADHGVDIAEQTYFVVTGSSLELSSNAL